MPEMPVAFDPTVNMLQAIYDADVAAGGGSFWVDRVLERPAGGSGGDELYTKGRALYMYTHDEDELGFAGSGTGANQGGGGFAYREAIQSGETDLYTVEIDGAELEEVSEERRQYPSHWTSVHTGAGLSVAQRKFITHNNVAVTVLEITNTGTEATTRTLVAETPDEVTQAASPDGSERTGSFTTRYDETTVSTRFSGEGFTAAGDDLVREITLAPGETATMKLQLGAIAAEIPESGPEYERYRDMDAETAFSTQLAEYNRVVGRQRPVHRRARREHRQDVVVPDVPQPVQLLRRQHPRQRLPVPRLGRGRARLQQRHPAHPTDAHAGPEVLP